MNSEPYKKYKKCFEIFYKICVDVVLCCVVLKNGVGLQNDQNDPVFLYNCQTFRTLFVAKWRLLKFLQFSLFLFVYRIIVAANVLKVPVDEKSTPIGVEKQGLRVVNITLPPSSVYCISFVVLKYLCARVGIKLWEFSSLELKACKFCVRAVVPCDYQSCCPKLRLTEVAW
jgi:hypothetical protein